MDGLTREPTERIDTTSCERKNYESQGETRCTTKYS